MRVLGTADKNILVLYQVRSGNNIGPPTPAGKIPSFFIIAINRYRTSSYDVSLAIDVSVAYLLSKL